MKNQDICPWCDQIGQDTNGSGFWCDNGHHWGSRVIVSRHPATVAYIKEMLPEFRNAAVITGNAEEVQLVGMIVCGNLPLKLASVCMEVISVEFSGQAPRGAEYGRAELEAAGVYFGRYTVQRKI